MGCDRLDCLHLLQSGGLNVSIAPKPEKVKGKSGVTLNWSAPTPGGEQTNRAWGLTAWIRNVAMLPSLRALPPGEPYSVLRDRHDDRVVAGGAVGNDPGALVGLRGT